MLRPRLRVILQQSFLPSVARVQAFPFAGHYLSNTARYEGTGDLEIITQGLVLVGRKNGDGGGARREEKREGGREGSADSVVIR